MIDQMQQTARGAQDLTPLRTAVFMRGDGTQKAMPGGERIVFAAQLET